MNFFAPKVGKNAKNAKNLTQFSAFETIETAQLPCEPLIILTDAKKKTPHTIQTFLRFLFLPGKFQFFLKKQPFPNKEKEAQNGLDRMRSFFFGVTRGSHEK